MTKENVLKLPENFQELFKNVQDIQKNIAETQEQLKSKEVSATVGGGMVTAVANGAQQIVSLEIDPSVVNKEEIEMLQDLVKASVNEALRKSRDMAQGELSKLTGGVPIPGFS